MTLPEGHVYVDLLQVLREQDDILANEAAAEIERLRAMRKDEREIAIRVRNATIEVCARYLESCTEVAERDGWTTYDYVFAIRALKASSPSR